MMLECAVADKGAKAVIDAGKAVDRKEYIECDGGTVAVKNEDGSVTLGDGTNLRDCLHLDPHLDGKWVPLP